MFSFFPLGKIVRLCWLQSLEETASSHNIHSFLGVLIHSKNSDLSAWRTTLAAKQICLILHLRLVDGEQLGQAPPWLTNFLDTELFRTSWNYSLRTHSQLCCTPSHLINTVPERQILLVPLTIFLCNTTKYWALNPTIFLCTTIKYWTLPHNLSLPYHTILVSEVSSGEDVIWSYSSLSSAHL